MKKINTIIFAAFALTCTSLAYASSATEISPQQGTSLEKTGVISAAGFTTLDDLNDALAMKALESGATHYSVTGVIGHNKLSGTANLYR
ncbi:TPA: YdgH/BhsA/McbA-like domain containing protein [Salmonella enterica subsp. diarizonae serovar 50:k:z35]